MVRWNTLRTSVLSAFLSFGVMACGTNTSSTFGGGGGTSDGSTDGSDAGGFYLNDASFNLGDGSTSVGTLSVNQSSPQNVVVTIGQPLPQITFVASENGVVVTPTWVITQGGLASITSAGVFSPTGTAAGQVIVTATYKGVSVGLLVNISIVGDQNGAYSSQSLPTAGAGGFGGVGGEGVGPAIQDTGIVTALNGPPAGTAASQNLVLLYPYSGTVWPQGLLAPLLQWSSNLTNITGIKMTLASSTGNFNWSGIFGPPPTIYLDGGIGNFVRHPILQDVWAAATNSTGGSNTLTMTLTVASGTGASAVAYGPVTSTWSIAPAALTGTIYYNSYGTALAVNSVPGWYAAGTSMGIGAAVLSIAAGAPSPVVAAGYNTPTSQGGCRVCHVVAGGGSVLIAQEGSSYYSTYAYTPGVTNPDAGVLINGASSTADGTFAWAGLSYDGKLALSNAGDLAANTTYTQLYPFPPSGPKAVPYDAGGLPSTLKTALPVFSSDTSRVAFTMLNSLDGGQIPGLTCTYDCLAAMTFDRSTFTFSNPVKLFDVSNHVGFASFMPTNDSVVFQRQIIPETGYGEYLATRLNATAQIYWADLATGTGVVLSTLNGIGPGGTTYLPSNPKTGHANGNDVNLNYEPTVNPVSTGGYAWVIFTSRRIYGNVATQAAWLSNPATSGYNYQSPNQITTKKLWVAAMDLNAPAGSDPSHPAFYLPGQEIQAGNARGYWVVGPCSADGVSCTSGSQCCNAYCSNTGANGANVCGGPPATPTCSGLGNPCGPITACCDNSNLCIDGFCSLSAPR